MAHDFRERFPHLGEAMRVLTTVEDTPETTSFETYLRGELGTYSDRTVALYHDFVERLRHERRNLTEETIQQYGFVWLDLRIWHRLRPHSKHSENTP